MTRDVDVAIARADLNAVRAAVEPPGFIVHQTESDFEFCDPENARPRSGVHLVFLNEKVRPDYLEPVPASEPIATNEGILIAPVADLVRMKLTSFRLKDKVHIQELLDAVRLITTEIEACLSDPLRQRLQEVRATE